MCAFPKGDYGFGVLQRDKRNVLLQFSAQPVPKLDSRSIGSLIHTAYSVAPRTR